jgi:hypothetical protein
MADDSESRFAPLKDAMARIMAAPANDRVVLTKEFLDGLQRQDQETFSNVITWSRNGAFLWAAVESSVRSAQARTDLSDSDKLNVLDDAVTFGAALKTLASNPVTRDIAMELASSALFVGLQAGLKPDEIERLRTDAFRSRQSELGKRAAKTNKANRTMLPAVIDIAKSYCRSKRYKSVNKLAEYVIGVLLQTSKPCPSLRTTVKYINEAIESGEIPKPSL